MTSEPHANTALPDADDMPTGELTASLMPSPGSMPGVPGVNIESETGEKLSRSRRFTQALSLRTQLVLVTSFLIALAIAVTSLVAISALRSQMVQQLDEEMRASSSTITTLMTTRNSERNASLGSYRAYLLDKDGTVLYQASSEQQTPGENGPDISGWNADKVAKNSLSGATVNGGPGSSDWRILPITLDNSGSDSALGPATSVIIAVPLKQTNQVVALVGVLTFAFGVATLISAIAMTWVLVTRTFEPLARVEQTAAKIAAGDLSQRIEDYNPNNEIGHLSTSLNTMLSQIEASFKAQARSEAKMRRFVGDASHELRTPLVSIRGYAELYRQGALPNADAVAMAMDRIESESKRMGQLVEDLLTLARIDERRESQLAPFDLFNLAVDATNDAYATSPDRAVTLMGLTPTEPPTQATVLGDEQRMRQVIANLITNAMRYTPEGTPLEIAVGVRQEGPLGVRSVIQVRDHGPGIHGEDRERVFERFYRTDASRSRQTGGTGLGLSIAAAIIEQHEGSIHIEETPGGGATFVISLPFVPPQLPPQVAESMAPAPAPGTF
ncbi:MAG: HAMP domain-containing sensor histidine kinase [Rothia sp. (in: high G+C Gram-positive bacteria)]|uniref:sensor histidine kinase n=1 Tax=Rothia sp. (in: high G+C Gram-positive bacteria) TaxID=1885016 RepID=UPI0026DEF6E5|nr:HAMP domain-containing sensor histidine kinase [Rothia sp. (in: high G+C Gram-positive bacteria)]MDO5749822.1 HAMP domain-containing sensor histidine kinase [Rothia sp. (in: high G+C Gram-positive bacteria)]